MRASGRSRPDVPAGGWPKAVRLLNEGVLDGLQTQVLSGVTESGKAFTLSDGIANVRRPSPALAHNPAPHSTAFLFPSCKAGREIGAFGLVVLRRQERGKQKKRRDSFSPLFVVRTAGEQRSKTALEQPGNADFHSKSYGRTNALRLVQIISGDVVFQKVRLRDKRGFQMIAFVFQYSEFEIQKLGRYI